MINMQNKIRNIKGKLEILQYLSSALVVVVLVFVAVVNSHQLFPHTQVYVGIGFSRRSLGDGRLPRAVARLRF